MAGDARDRVTIDLRGLSAALHARARARRTTAASLARAAIAAMLRDEGPAPDAVNSAHCIALPHRLIKVTVRLATDHAVRLATQARAADVSQGGYLAALIDGQAPPPKPPDYSHLVAALAASTTELAAVAADINAFMRQLRQGALPSNPQVQERWYGFAEEIRDHLSLASATLAALRPAQRRGYGADGPPLNAERSDP